jgi:hypothetical protein
MALQDTESVSALAEITGRALYLAFEVFVDGSRLLPTGRTLPIVAGSRVDAGAQTLTELRAFEARIQGCTSAPTTFWVGEHRYWLVAAAAEYPKAAADVDGIWLHWRRRFDERPRRHA